MRRRFYQKPSLISLVLSIVADLTEYVKKDNLVWRVSANRLERVFEIQLGVLWLYHGNEHVKKI